MLINKDIDYKVLAKHFQGERTIVIANEAFRKLRRKYEQGVPGKWIIFVKAYNYDIGLVKENNE